MTDFDPYGQHPFTYDPLGRVPYPDPPPGPPPFAPPPPPPQRPPANAFATLSVVFAFVFAPLGAILGHAGLRQIRRTGEPGRDRAVLGLALSYAFTALALVALVAWAVLGASTADRTAAPATTSTAPPGPPGPTVAPDAVATLLPGADALRNITGDANLESGQTWDHPARSDREGTIDRQECWASIAPGTPDAYPAGTVTGYRAAEFTDTRSLLKSVQIIAATATFPDPPAARSQLARVLSGWRQCGGTTVDVTMPGGPAVPFDLGPPVDAGNGVTTMDLTPKGLQVRSVRAIAAKANVVVDLYVADKGTTDAGAARQTAGSIATYILGKVPG
ncbi:sensor domain-containing protein [Mycobacterium parmense]|uniref:Uncharacterized protein n=1 Tax=Mycobacterium parmense TaxID=185642 RepID=A0A7I7YVM9_9MYCO|nr:sensor domain-containing protein [Mycobacterium parmense]ORW60737.1 nuclease PIN [Mycobacterium parmense]BBZ45357.1 hypothetical protein MPRM_26380 [Mycobacterium parmense]